MHEYSDSYSKIRLMLEKGPELSFLLQVFEVLPEVVLVVDSERRVLAANRAAREFVGAALHQGNLKTGELLTCLHSKRAGGCGYSSFCSFCSIKTTLEECLKSGEPVFNREAVMALEKEKTVSIVNVLINCLPLDLSGQKIAVLTLSDITDLKAMERERYEQMERFSLIGCLAASLIHDLKNPLTGVSGFLELLRSRLSDEDTRKICQKMEGALDRAFQVIDNILLVASGKEDVPLDITPTRVDQLVKSVLEDFRPLHPVSLLLDYPDEISVDVGKMRRVLWNLIKNADEALSEISGGRITILSWNSQDTVTICVADNGPGIPPEVRDRVFLPGYTRGKEKGRGFGLFGSKKIVEAHGGRIWFESVCGQGTKFFVQLPLKAT